ncbi:rRNA maturation RNase YbeY ['Camptotheca acuminata' phytoplasma]|uniref:rRNA maturation RNase YbeY n=1 Tax='Camptotheca acuminata' phytoplasma TaxID=3239192 RepID=UPI003519E757
MIIEVYNQTNRNVFDLKQKLHFVFDSLEDDRKMNVIFINNIKMKEMNSFYRKKDYPTDVLSFENVIDDIYLGDVYISLTKASSQARELGKTLIEEVVFLSLHGYLHLKGYKDDTEEELLEMIRIQDEILKKHTF